MREIITSQSLTAFRGIKMFKTTEQHKKFWEERKIDWNKDYASTWNHPHRTLIAAALHSFFWVSLWEVGVGAGANLIRIVREFKGKQLGGSDINADAIAECQKIFPNGKFHVESAEDMLLSDKAVDVLLSDAALIYIDPKKIDKVIREMTRSARVRIVLCEFHSKNWLKRMMFRWKSGYHSYNYYKLLKKHGCYDIQIIKIPKEYWPGTPWEEWGYIIMAKVSHK